MIEENIMADNEQQRSEEEMFERFNHHVESYSAGRLRLSADIRTMIDKMDELTLVHPDAKVDSSRIGRIMFARRLVMCAHDLVHDGSEYCTESVADELYRLYVRCKRLVNPEFEKDADV